MDGERAGERQREGKQKETQKIREDEAKEREIDRDGKRQRESEGKTQSPLALCAKHSKQVKWACAKPWPLCAVKALCLQRASRGAGQRNDPPSESTYGQWGLDQSGLSDTNCRVQRPGRGSDFRLGAKQVAGQQARILNLARQT